MHPRGVFDPTGCTQARNGFPGMSRSPRTLTSSGCRQGSMRSHDKKDLSAEWRMGMPHSHRFWDGCQAHTKKLCGDGVAQIVNLPFVLAFPSLWPSSHYPLGVRNASTSTTNFFRCVVTVNRCPPSNRMRREFGIWACICSAKATGAMWSELPCRMRVGCLISPSRRTSQALDRRSQPTQDLSIVTRSTSRCRPRQPRACRHSAS